MITIATQRVVRAHRIPVPNWWWLFGAAVAFNLFQLAVSWHSNLLGDGAFRQTQTAITSYWLAHGSNWLAYETPVLGAPWSIPFEFPLYQWLVAVLASHATFLTLDQAGRVVSEMFFLGCLWPGWRVATHFECGRPLFRTCATLVLLSPLYIFWSRAFMIESTVLFFSIWFVASVADYLSRPTLVGFAEMLLVAGLAACIKITTFVGFSLAAAAIVLVAFAADRNRWVARRMLLRLSTALAVAIAIGTLLIWLRWSDELKDLNWYAGALTANAPGIKQWTFGTLAQRESWPFWHMVLVRGPNDALGSWVVAAITLAYALLRMRGRRLGVYLFLLFLYFIVFLIFTNLHVAQPYYQYANSIFLVTATGTCVCASIDRDRLIGIAMMLLCCIAGVAGFYARFSAYIHEPNRMQEVLLVDYLRKVVPAGDVLFATGIDWSPEVPYYAQRRAILIPNFATGPQLSWLGSNLHNAAGGLTIGAVVVCPNSLADNPETLVSYNRLLNAVIGDKRPHVVGACVVYS